MLVLPLSAKHDRKGFDCGEPELNIWFAQLARQHQEKRLTSTFVLVDSMDANEVNGYYAISPTELVNLDLPEKLQRRLPRKIPAFRLGRLAVGIAHKGRKLGAFLLFDAIDRVTRISSDVGGVCLVVNAKPSALDFYKRYGFEPMADHPNNLFISL